MHDQTDDDRDPATEMAPGATRRERDLPVAPETAWELLRDAEGLATWLADEVDLVIEPGERGTLRDGDGAPREVEVESVDPGRRLSLRWATETGDEAIVDLTLTPSDLGTRLVVTELPLRLARIPETAPATWAPARGAGGSGPQLRALAHA